MKNPPKEYRSFDSLKAIIRDLYDPNGGCPWDLDQTHLSLCKYAIEEVYELVEAIESSQMEDVREELGDVLLQVMIHAELARKSGHFDIHDVIESIGSKMVRRHPHVFAGLEVESSNDVLKNWEQIKRSEKASATTPLISVPTDLPALSVADKVGAKSQKYNFDWETKEQVFAKVDEEVEEVREAIASGERDAIEDEIGDLLFVVAQVARHHGIDPEQALRRSNRKFLSRFEQMMSDASLDGVDFANLPLEKKEERWQAAKKKLKS